MNRRNMHPRFNDTFRYYTNVPDDLRESFWNYLAYGFKPGSFGMAVLRNDFIDASCRAHPALTSATFRDLAKWFGQCVPSQAYGSQENIDAWIAKTDQERLDIMIEYRLRPGEFEILRGTAIA